MLKALDALPESDVLLDADDGATPPASPTYVALSEDAEEGALQDHRCAFSEGILLANAKASSWTGGVKGFRAFSRIHG